MLKIVDQIYKPSKQNTLVLCVKCMKICKSKLMKHHQYIMNLLGIRNLEYIMLSQQYQYKTKILSHRL